jgi:hypothetical protein
MLVGNLLDVPPNLLDVPPNHCSVLCHYPTNYATIGYLHHRRFIMSPGVTVVVINQAVAGYFSVL